MLAELPGFEPFKKVSISESRGLVFFHARTLYDIMITVSHFAFMLEVMFLL